jgi:hypothetical protein
MTASGEIILAQVPLSVAGLAAEAPALFRRVGNHTMRATGITGYLKNNGSLAEARRMGNHADTRTTQLYDRREDTAPLDEHGKVGI